MLDPTATAVDILALTNDGDDLGPHHLVLVENAVNGRLSPASATALDELLASARAGYTRPPLHGVEHMTIGPHGYVYWRTHQVEHFSLRYAQSDAGKAFTQELATRCRIIEERGDIPSPTTAIWHWPRTQREIDQREYRSVRDKVPPSAPPDHPHALYADTLAAAFHRRYHVWPEQPP